MSKGVESAYYLAKKHGISYHTARAYMARVEAAWADRNPRSLEEMRRHQLRKAAEVERLALESAAAALAMVEDVGPAALSIQQSGLRVALEAQARTAKLLGLDSERRVVELDRATLDSIRAERMAEAGAVAQQINPIQQIYALPSSESA